MNIIFSLNKLLNHPDNKTDKIRALARIIWWKFNQKLFKIPAVIQLTPQAKCICYPDSSFGGLIIYTKWPEHAEMNYIYNNLSDKDIFIDVGANIGAMSLIAGSIITKGSVYAFEPTQKAITRLQENISLNGFHDRIEVIGKAVSNKKGLIKFVNSDISELNHILPGNDKDMPNNAITVNTTTLDYFANQKKLKAIKILKIDVEGAEYDVLLGAKKLLSNKIVNTIIVELNTMSIHHGHSNWETIKLLKSYGYKIYQFNKNGKLVKFSPSEKINHQIINIIARIK